MRDADHTFEHIKHFSCHCSDNHLYLNSFSTRRSSDLDGLDLEESKRFMHHYNFPQFSVGETGPIRGPGRREIGHGPDRKSTRLNSTHVAISYAVFCSKKKTICAWKKSRNDKITVVVMM